MKTKVIFIFGLVFLMAMFSFQITPKVEAAGSPTVLSVTTNHANGYFKNAEVINFQIVFSEAVDVAGNNPVLALNSGGIATYTSGTGSDTLVFSYSVGVSDNSSDLSYTATSSLTTTGTIKSVSDGTDTTNDLPDLSVFLAAYDIIIDTTAPSVTKLGDNSSDYTIAGGASVDLLFNDSLASSSKTAIETALTNAADKDITYSWDATSSVVTINGNVSLTTFANDVKVFNILDLAGNSTNELLLIDSKKETNQVEPTSGSVTINSTTPQALLTNPNEAVNIIVSHPVSNPSVDATNFVNNGVGVMPNITISIPGVASVNVPTSTTFTAASSSWTGIIGAPTITTVTLDADKTLSSAFEVGSTQSKLTFDKAVRIFVLDEGGKRVGYVDNGSSVEITTTCGSDSQVWTDANLGSSGDCKMDSGSDLIVWTKHFTKFAVYTQNTPSTCSPDTVANGTVAAYPSCAVTCNSGYSLSGNSCVARSSGGGAIAGPVVSKNMTTISTVLMPVKLTLTSAQTGTLTQNLNNNYVVKLNVLEDGVATKTDFSISDYAIGNLKPTTNLETVLFNSNIFEINGINSNGLINNTLLKDATINITYPNLPSDLSGVGLYYYDAANKKWSLVSDANFDNSKGLISFSAKDLGKFAIFKSADKSKTKEFVLGSQSNSSVSSTSLDSSYITKVLSEERQNVKSVDNSLVKKLAGKILLQVANLGRAWYVDPVSSVRYYLADGTSSYNALRKFGLGIKNADISKIPVGVDNGSEAPDSDSDGLSDKMEQALGTDINKADSDGDGFSDKLEVMNSYSPLGVGKINQSKNLVDKLKGRIVLQTEGLGQVWYINPSDGKRYYLADGEAAYQIMRQLSLGINNDLINKIPVAK